MSSVMSAYRPGTSFLHRMSAGSKLFCLFAIAVTVLIFKGPVPGLVLLGSALVLLLLSGAPVWFTLRGLRGLAVIATFMAIYLVLAQGWVRAVESVSELFGLVILAGVLTATTPVDEMLDTITRGLRPLPGVNEEQVALAFSLMIRTIPETIELAQQSRDAARARGVERSLSARLIPLAIRVVARARQTGEALHARGVLDD